MKLRIILLSLLNIIINQVFTKLELHNPLLQCYVCVRDNLSTCKVLLIIIKKITTSVAMYLTARCSEYVTYTTAIPKTLVQCSYYTHNQRIASSFFSVTATSIYYCWWSHHAVNIISTMKIIFWCRWTSLLIITTTCF